MKNKILTVAILLLLLILPKHGCPQYTEWKTRDILETAKAEQKARELEVAKKPKSELVMIGTKWSKDLYEPIQHGQSMQFTPVGSPGVKMLARKNYGTVVPWNTDQPTNVWDCANLEFKVDPIHNPDAVVLMRVTRLDP